MTRTIPLLLGLLLLATRHRPAGASLTLTLGNPTPGFNDGDIVSVLDVTTPSRDNPPRSIRATAPTLSRTPTSPRAGPSAPTDS